METFAKEIITVDNDRDGLLSRECRAAGKDAYDIVDLLWNSLPNHGCGLAAPQIGIDAKVCIIKTEQIELSLINPRGITPRGFLLKTTEGCLSIPGKEYELHRKSAVQFLMETPKRDTLPYTQMSNAITNGFVKKVGRAKFYDIYRIGIEELNWDDNSSSPYINAAIIAQHEIDHLYGRLISVKGKLK